VKRSPLTISLYTPDVQATVDFWRDVFAFEQTAAWEEDGQPIWAEVARDGPEGTARVWFFSGEIVDAPRPHLSGVVYVFVADVDAEAARIGDRARRHWGPETQEYGLRELGVFDPNGYIVCFAKDV